MASPSSKAQNDADASALLNSEVRNRLREHFAVAFEEHGKRWDTLWEQSTFLPWDRGEPNPALVDALAERKELLGEPVVEGRRKRALVPGCGKGYDVLLLASAGYDAYGLEISENAVRLCGELAEKEFPKYAERGSKEGPGVHKFILGDFFTDDWVGEAGGGGGFDLIYDYTFLCALPVDQRPAWAQRISQLLAPRSTGRLICVEFPTFKDPSTGGPPFGLKPEVYIAHLTNPGTKLPYASDGWPDETTYEEKAVEMTRNGLALERMAHWKPERTHAIGKGTDNVSIWRHTR